ncbi:MBL fold metallo-hydrolase [Ammoniphilus sp. CFH 90114]|uniref:MBL fold metallo-hydrolase n=1 Tax=Ammoniphilus sp. CFH 90114 TaxID=2493665 RepID=UPI00100E4388|nr:MBL fold metallo-hydrolase [Ammoniphilus sp. CFH 90114]RXT15262.1 MBL fold metallo-hydrolase [Ammoniphilus sp. CFH 90114]
MKLTCLGTWGAYPEAGSATTSFLLEEDDFRLLIDCGSGVLAQLQRVIKVEQLDALILSHFHHDHIADIGCLQYATLIQTILGNRSVPLPIYAHQEEGNQFSSLTYNSYTQGVQVSAHQPIHIGPWQVDFCPTNHAAYCLAMRFSDQRNTLIYTADTSWSDELVEFSRGADLLICEASLYNEQKGKVSGHMTGGEAGKLARQAGVKQLILTHLPHYGDQQLLVIQAQEEYEGPIHLAASLSSWEW